MGKPKTNANTAINDFFIGILLSVKILKEVGIEGSLASKLVQYTDMKVASQEKSTQKNQPQKINHN
jgi:hypothetical protein